MKPFLYIRCSVAQETEATETQILELKFKHEVVTAHNRADTFAKGGNNWEINHDVIRFNHYAVDLSTALTREQAGQVYYEALCLEIAEARKMVAGPEYDAAREKRHEEIMSLRKGLLDAFAVDYVSREDYDALKSVWHNPAAHHANLLRNPVLTRDQLLHLAGAGDYDALNQRATAAEAACAEMRAFMEKIQKQKPEKPDHWCSCGQCENNTSDADDILDSTTHGTGWLPPEAAALLRAIVEQREAEAALAVATAKALEAEASKLKQERDELSSELLNVIPTNAAMFEALKDIRDNPRVSAIIGRYAPGTMELVERIIAIETKVATAAESAAKGDA